MSGGWRIYCNERMFAIIASERRWLRVDDLSRARMELEATWRATKPRKGNAA